MRDDSVYLAYILENIEVIEGYLAGPGGGPDERLFFDDLRTQDAVLRRMETMAEAAGHLSAELRARHPQLDWRQITDFRNILAHAYLQIDLDLVWQTIQSDLPSLKSLVASESHQLSSQSSVEDPSSEARS